ncbi:hypothetical protein [Streptomyces sp. CB02400]|uniref:hypothetical protein n=1 Tax=unclassified Streptomyces TaxID=2593676 RepID=UPI0019142A4F|nr:hypothetical protein [Streptomyces sp. CB02400]
MKPSEEQVDVESLPQPGGRDAVRLQDADPVGAGAKTPWSVWTRLTVSSVTVVALNSVPPHLAGMAGATTDMLRGLGFALGPSSVRSPSAARDRRSRRTCRVRT